MIFIAILALIEAVLFLSNYRAGTYLIGWDNLMPEFNLALNFKRALFSIWQDYRGLGLTDGMAQAANLIHTVHIYILSIVLPQNLLRYSTITLLHLAGGIAMYFLIKKLLIKNANGQWIAFAASLFYMFNIGVIQIFYAPLEAFAYFFAALPLLSLWIKNSLDKPSPKNLLALSISSLLVSPFGFVPTLFIVFLMLFAAFAFMDFAEERSFKKIFLVGAMIFSANAFWIIPYSYTALHTAKTIQSARINQFSSEEIYYRNAAEGDISSVLSMKGFMLNSIEHDNHNNQDILFMQKWRDLYSKFYVQIVSLTFILIFFIGILSSVLKRQKQFYPFLIGGALSFFFLANNTLILAQLNSLIRTLLPAFGEAFRFPFTKFIILFAFCFSIFAAQGISFIFERLSKIQTYIHYSLFLFLISAILWIAHPAFFGDFYSPLLRIALPSEYKELFSYFSSKNPQARIALLPSFTFWNWQYRNWGQLGSGFDWYGLPQPILERAFDPWSLYNEQFYNELSYAINRDDKTLFERVLQKYQIRYLLLDETLENSVTRASINYPSLENFLTSSSMVIKEKTIGSLIIYNVLNAKPSLYTVDATSLPKVSQGFHFANQDTSYNALGDFVEEKNSPKISYILPSTYTGKLQENLQFEAENNKGTIILRPKILLNRVSQNAQLELPSLFENEFLIPVEAKFQKGAIIFSPIYPGIVINGVTYKPQEANIVVETPIDNPTSIEFIDTKNLVQVKNGTARGFILNNSINVIKVKNTRGEALITVNTQNLPKAHFFIPVPEGKIENISIIVDKINSPFNIENVIQKRQFNIEKKQDFFSLFGKSILTRTKYTNDGFEMTAAGNSSIDLAFYSADLPHEESYIMFADSTYKSGPPVNFYIENSFSGRSETETKLSKTKKQNVMILSQTQDAFSGYGFHFIVKSVGREQAISVLNNFHLFPFPEETINNIRIVNGTFTIASAITNVSENKINPSLYKVTLPKAKFSNYLVLDQAFDSGWAAYSVKNSNFGSLAFPFIFGTKIKHHVEANGWANGWLLSADNSRSTDHSILIVYLPQYLEYAGFALLIVTCIFIASRFAITKMNG